MGCLPVVITLYGDNPILKRDCIDNFSSIARDYNQILQKELKTMQLQLQPSGSRIAYFDAYGPLEEMTLGRKYGKSLDQQIQRDNELSINGDHLVDAHELIPSEPIPRNIYFLSYFTFTMSTNSKVAASIIYVQNMCHILT